MDAATFETAAFGQPEAVAGGRQGNLDFRVGGKVFATYDPAKDLGALKLTPEEQAMLTAAADAFFPANGAWGAKGWTKIALAAAPEGDVRAGLKMAWANVAPKTILKRYIGGDGL